MTRLSVYIHRLGLPKQAEAVDAPTSNIVVAIAAAVTAHPWIESSSLSFGVLVGEEEHPILVSEKATGQLHKKLRANSVRKFVSHMLSAPDHELFVLTSKGRSCNNPESAMTAAAERGWPGSRTAGLLVAIVAPNSGQVFKLESMSRRLTFAASR